MRIRWTDLAARDLTEICDYIEEHNGGTIARSVAVYVHDRVSVWMEFPESGRSIVLAPWQPDPSKGKFSEICRGRKS